MRKCLLIGGSFAFVGAALAGDPPGAIVIRPQTSAPAEKPGFIVIRPFQPPVLPPTTPAVPRVLDGAPKPQAPSGATPIPVPVPVPVPIPTENIKPATDAEKGKILVETWDTAYLKGYKVGHFHVVVREHIRDGKPFVYSTKKQELTVARFGQQVKQEAEDATLETPEGEVLVVRMIQQVSTGQKLAITGTVNGNKLSIKGEGPAATAEDVPWPAGVLGIARESSLYKDRKPKPGDTFEYRTYEGRLNRAVKITVTAKAVENVALVEGQPAKPHLRLSVEMEPIGKFRIPAATVWCDAETYEPIRTDQDMPSLGGKLTLLRTTKQVALQPVGKVPDLFDVQSIRLDREVPGIHDKSAIVYRITLTGDAEPGSAFVIDDRQVLTKVTDDGATFDLRITHGNAVVAGAAPAVAPSAEYLSSSFFIDWDNDLVKRTAATAVSGLPATATAAQKARAIETWVHKNMKAVEFSQAMATTSETAKALSGDCTEYAMLAAGLCRAQGIPSRTALGLVYAPGPGGKPCLAYHMWFEAFVDSRWIPFDATLGRGGVGPGHIKITETSWFNEKSFAPLLPVLRVLMAQPKVSVTTVEGR